MEREYCVLINTKQTLFSLGGNSKQRSQQTVNDSNFNTPQKGEKKQLAGKRRRGSNYLTLR